MKVTFILFFSLFLLSFFSVHFFVYLCVTRGLDLSKKYRIVFALFLVLLALSFIFPKINYFNITFLPVVYTGSVWFGVLFISCMVFLIRFPFSFFLKRHNFKTTLASIVVIIFVSSYSIWNGLRVPVIKEISIESKYISKKLSGFVIVQISDLHIDMLTGDDWLRKVVKKVNSINPDIIVLTGDILDRRKLENKYYEILRKMKTNRGIYAITGNHEHHNKVDIYSEFLEKINAKPLFNTRKVFPEGLSLTGINDNVIKNDTLFSNILKDLDSVCFNILLLHRPVRFEESARKGINLQLSGHTHAGQIAPMNIIIPFLYKFHYGLYQIGNSHIYTTSGTGTWGPPMRFFTRSEIVKIVLKKQ